MDCSGGGEFQQIFHQIGRLVVWYSVDGTDHLWTYSLSRSAMVSINWGSSTNVVIGIIRPNVSFRGHRRWKERGKFMYSVTRQSNAENNLEFGFGTVENVDFDMSHDRVWRSLDYVLPLLFRRHTHFWEKMNFRCGNSSE